MADLIDPWASFSLDYDKLVNQFGIGKISDVIGDVNSRRGKMEGMEARSGMQIIRAFIPLSEIFGYATDLRSQTQGRGTYAMEPSHYEEVPKSVLEKIVASRTKKED